MGEHRLGGVRGGAQGVHLCAPHCQAVGGLSCLSKVQPGARMHSHRHGLLLGPQNAGFLWRCPGKWAPQWPLPVDTRGSHSSFQGRMHL